MRMLRYVCLLVVLLAGCGGGRTIVPGFFPSFLVDDVRVGTAGMQAEDAQLCCSGSNVYAVWADTASGNVLFNRSSDGGTTWEAVPVAVNTAAGAAFAPRICCVGSRIYVAWPDGRSGTRDDVYFNYSTDGGLTWQPSDVRLDTKVSGSSGDLRICCDSVFVYVAWEDTRDGGTDVYLNSSTDGGVNWQATEKRVDRGDAAGSADSGELSICCQLLTVYVVWEDERDDAADLVGDIYFNCSENGGVGWLPNSVRLNTNAAGATDSRDPVICCSAQYVYVAWSDSRFGQPDVFVNHSEDSGITWQPSDTRIENDAAGASASVTPDICCSLASVWVTWSDDRVVPGAGDVYVNFSTDGGFSWENADTLLNTGAGNSDCTNARICCESSTLYVAWEDDRNGAKDIFFCYSTNRGVNWSSSDIRLDRDVGTNDSLDPVVCCDGFNVYVAWIDERGAADEVYFNASAQ